MNKEAKNTWEIAAYAILKDIAEYLYQHKAIIRQNGNLIFTFISGSNYDTRLFDDDIQSGLFNHITLRFPKEITEELNHVKEIQEFKNEHGFELNFEKINGKIDFYKKIGEGISNWQAVKGNPKILKRKNYKFISKNEGYKEYEETIESNLYQRFKKENPELTNKELYYYYYWLFNFTGISNRVENLLHRIWQIKPHNKFPNQIINNTLFDLSKNETKEYMDVIEEIISIPLRSRNLSAYKARIGSSFKYMKNNKHYRANLKEFEVSSRNIIAVMYSQGYFTSIDHNQEIESDKKNIKVGFNYFLEFFNEVQFTVKYEYQIDLMLEDYRKIVSRGQDSNIEKFKKLTSDNGANLETIHSNFQKNILTNGEMKFDPSKALFWFKGEESALSNKINSKENHLLEIYFENKDKLLRYDEIATLLQNKNNQENIDIELNTVAKYQSRLKQALLENKKFTEEDYKGYFQTNKGYKFKNMTNLS